ncbi:hypothetical protein M514_14731, partial [Trichuris suis]
IGRTAAEHWERVGAVLARLHRAGIRLQRNKCFFGVEEAECLGFRIDKHGLHPTLEKAEAIPKREPHEQAFKRAKELPQFSNLLIHYDPQNKLTLTCDASPHGVGAVLSQPIAKGKEAPVAFSSRTLSKTEGSYTQIDKEALAIIYAVTKFHQYVLVWSFSYNCNGPKLLLGLLHPRRLLPRNVTANATKEPDACGEIFSFLKRAWRRPGNRTINERRQNSSASNALYLTRLAREETAKPSPAFYPTEGRFSTSKLITIGKPREKARSKVFILLAEAHPGVVRMRGLACSYVWQPQLDNDIVKTCRNTHQTKHRRTHWK